MRTIQRPNDESNDSFIHIIVSSEYFDSEWYARTYPVGASSTLDLARHYLTRGYLEGYDPSPRFSTARYLARNPDVHQGRMNPLLHYELFGHDERRLLFPQDREIIAKSVYWRESWYRDAYLRGDESVDAIKHFLDHGTSALLDPGPYFSSSEYYEENPDVCAAAMNPLIHWEVYGKYERRRITPWAVTVQRFKAGAFKSLALAPAIIGPVDQPKDVRIYISSVSDCFVPRNPLLIPVQAGAALAARHFANMQADDEGDNISDRNRAYCELTVQYWAWKNVDADYYGFFHNRRYFSFETERLLPQDINGCVRFDCIDGLAIDKLHLNEEDMREVIERHDIVVMEPLFVGMDPVFGHAPTLRTQYALSLNHYVEDLELAVSILIRDHPEYAAAADEYLSMSEGVYLNMFVMNKENFHLYCELLFPILDEVFHGVDISSRDVYGSRFVGFVAERFLGIFLLHQLTTNPNLRVHYAQFALFGNIVRPGSTAALLPAFGGDQVAIAISSSQSYSLLLAVLLRSIIENSSADRRYDIVILSDGISGTRIAELERMFSGRRNFSIRFVATKDHRDLSGLRAEGHIATTTYARFLVLDIFRGYDKVVYLDCDMVVSADIADLFDTDVAGYMLAAVRDTVMAAWCQAPGNDHDWYVEHYLKKQRIADYFNAGVLVLNLGEFRRRYSADDLFFLAAGQHFRWVDQDVLNMVCDGQVLFLDKCWDVMVNTVLEFNSMPQEMVLDVCDSLRRARITHFAGHQVPCFSPGQPNEEQFWKYARHTFAYDRLRALARVKREARVDMLRRRRLGGRLWCLLQRAPGTKRAVDLVRMVTRRAHDRLWPVA